MCLKQSLVFIYVNTSYIEMEFMDIYTSTVFCNNGKEFY